MRIAVCGLNLLGTTTAACLAEAGFEVNAWDQLSLKRQIDVGQEPGLAELIATGLASGKLSHAASAAEAVKDADAVWITWDTPLSKDGADTDFIFNRIDETLPYCVSGQLVIVSSQLPIGSVAKLQAKYSNLVLACIPENLRTGKAIECFKNPGRIIVGSASRTSTREKIHSLFLPFCRNIIWVGVESAEFAKHAINAWLSMSIAFANELGQIGIALGASPAATETALKTDERIGQKAYVRYGDGPGRHLSRDVAYLLKLAPEAHLLRGIQRAHDDWETANG